MVYLQAFHGTAHAALSSVMRQRLPSLAPPVLRPQVIAIRDLSTTTRLFAAIPPLRFDPAIRLVSLRLRRDTSRPLQTHDIHHPFFSRNQFCLQSFLAQPALPARTNPHGGDWSKRRSAKKTICRVPGHFVFRRIPVHPTTLTRFPTGLVRCHHRPSARSAATLSAAVAFRFPFAPQGMAENEPFDIKVYVPPQDHTSSRTAPIPPDPRNKTGQPESDSDWPERRSRHVTVTAHPSKRSERRDRQLFVSSVIPRLVTSFVRHSVQHLQQRSTDRLAFSRHGSR